MQPVLFVILELIFILHVRFTWSQEGQVWKLQIRKITGHEKKKQRVKKIQKVCCFCIITFFNDKIFTLRP